MAKRPYRAGIRVKDILEHFEEEGMTYAQAHTVWHAIPESEYRAIKQNENSPHYGEIVNDIFGEYADKALGPNWRADADDGLESCQDDGAKELQIPKADLVKLEEARKELYAMFSDADTAMLVKLQQVTEPMWNLTHRKYKAA